MSDVKLGFYTPSGTVEQLCTLSKGYYVVSHIIKDKKENIHIMKNAKDTDEGTLQDIMRRYMTANNITHISISSEDFGKIDLFGDFKLNYTLMPIVMREDTLPGIKSVKDVPIGDTIYVESLMIVKEG